MPPKGKKPAPKPAAKGGKPAPPYGKGDAKPAPKKGGKQPPKKK